MTTRDKTHDRLTRHLGRLYGYAISLCQDPEEAKGLVQECALKALAARNPPDDPAAHRAWLFKILRNGFLDRLRRKAVRESAAELIAAEQVPGEYWAADERLISVLTVKLELARLPQSHREIIGLIDIAGLSYGEAAEALEVPAGTVMSRISRARAALMAAIAEGPVRVLPLKERKSS
ncbi:MAG: RNA polymerase sigma factor [Pseudomonadota bacterium]